MSTGTNSGGEDKFSGTPAHCSEYGGVNVTHLSDDSEFYGVGSLVNIVRTCGFKFSHGIDEDQPH